MEGSEDYVELVMLSQQSAVVELTPNAKPVKKRHYSDADDGGTEHSVVKESSTNRKGKEKKSKQSDGCWRMGSIVMLMKMIRQSRAPFE